MFLAGKGVRGEVVSVHSLLIGVLQALRAAEESLAVIPTVHKSWVRMGDAFTAIQRWVQGPYYCCV